MYKTLIIGFAIGLPSKSEADSVSWFAVDGTNCYRLLLTKTKGNEIGTTAAASCGLK